MIYEAMQRTAKRIRRFLAARPYLRRIVHRLRHAKPPEPPKHDAPPDLLDELPLLYKQDERRARAYVERIETFDDETTQVFRNLCFTDLQDRREKDPWLFNFLINCWEFLHGATNVSSYPWNVTVPIVDFCNASCTFCDSWLRGQRWLALDEVERLTPVLRNARFLGLAGHGEPLIHPQFPELAASFSEKVDPRCSVYLITNGLHLNRQLDHLRRLNVRTYNISLNGASPSTHHEIMAMGENAFARVMENIKLLTEIRRSQDLDLHINISMVVVQQNVHEAADFVRLGNDLGVKTVYLRTLAPVPNWHPGLNYHTLPPYLHPEFERHRDEAKKAIAESAVYVQGNPDSWETRIFPADVEQKLLVEPPRLISRSEARNDKTIGEAIHGYTGSAEESGYDGRPLPKVQLPFIQEGAERNPYHRKPRFACKFVYQNLNLNDFYFWVYPCCYMDRVPGFEKMRFNGEEKFMDLWNSPAMVELRRRLNEGPLYNECKTCPPQS